jgi:hypothetical protein
LAEKFLKIRSGRYALSQHEQNDIDQILNEVEELRRELNAQAEAVSTSAVAEEVKAVLEPSVGETTHATQESEPAISDDLLKEIHASAEGPEALGEGFGDMESTLANLKEDLSVKTLLDETLDDQARRQSDRDNDSLQTEFSEEAPAAELEASMPEVTTPAANTPVAKMKEQTVTKASSEMTSQNESSDETSPSLTMSLTGSMTLKLKYEFAGQEVTVGFSDEFLKVELADGTEFKIPVGRQKALRRVA